MVKVLARVCWRVKRTGYIGFGYWLDVENNWLWEVQEMVKCDNMLSYWLEFNVGPGKVYLS
jgi:hypothetical protein